MSETTTPPRAGSILIIEGDDSTRRMLEAALRPAHEVVIAAAVADGLELAASTSLEAVVIGDKLPVLDAAAFLGGLAQRGLDPPVVVTGAPPATARIFELLRAGAIDYLRKPLAAKPVVEALSRAVTVAAGLRQRLEIRERSGAAVAVPAPPAAGSSRGPRPPQHAALAALSDGLKARTIEVPAVPTVVTELRKAIRGQRSSLDDVARLIQRDQSLSLDVLKIANSVIYARGARTSDLKLAVSRIGLTQLEGLIEAVFLRDCYQPRGALFKSLLAEIWKHSVAMAIAMRILADGMGAGPSRLDGGVAYASGLLSDVGAAYLLWLISEQAPELPMEIFLPFVRDRHEAVGGQLLAAMGLDAAIAQLGSYHHAQSAPTGVSLHWSLSAVASELVDRAVGGVDITRNTRRGVAFVGPCADALRLTEGALRKGADQLTIELEGILEALT